MNEQTRRRQDDVVDRAVRALRATPVPDEAPPEVLRRLKAACPGAPRQAPHKTLLQRISTMRRYTKAAAAVVLIAAAGLFVFLIVGPGGATVSWADVQRKIREARTLTFTATMEQEGVPAMEIKAMVKGTVSRQEMSKPEPMVIILDLAAKQVLSLVPRSKKAVLTNLADLPEAARKTLEGRDFLRVLKEMTSKPGTALGAKTIAGRKAKGYRVCEAGHVRATIWVDAETGDPMHMEVLQYGGRVKTTLRDFRLDPPLDDSLFSLKPPKGYQLMRLDLKSPSAQDVVAFLRFWVDARGGSFPETLSEIEWLKDCRRAINKLEKTLPQDRFKEFVSPLGRVRFFLQMRPDRFGYAGKGVKKGDAKAVVFWFRPEKQETYTVIYGDLRVKTGVAAADLPKPPATKPSPPK